MLYGIVLGVHVTSFAAALLSLAGSELLLALARRGQRPPAKAALLASKGGGALVAIGAVAGVALLAIGGWPLLTPWLLASFVLIAVLMAVERRFVRPWQARLQAALDGKAASTEVGRFAGEWAALVGRVAILALFALIALLMTLKPGLGS